MRRAADVPLPEQPEVDVIRDVLSRLRLSATVFAHVAYCGSWNLSTTGSRHCAFHLVARGTCWMHLQDRPAIRLAAGDLAMFPRDAWHNLCGSPAAVGATPVAPDDGDVSITCGYFEFAEARANPVLDALPDIVIVRGGRQGGENRIADLIGLLVAEAEAKQPGGAFVRDKLAEALFAMVLRAHLDAAEEKRGFLAALADPRMGRVLAAIHREPDREWRIEALAALAGMSRTGFAASFSELLGQTPMHYLADWRMWHATVMLRDPRNSVGGVAARLGYRSEAAFRRAFKRLRGLSPGALRREAKA
jgi:AraC-like DNA-binding protein